GAEELAPAPPPGHQQGQDQGRCQDGRQADEPRPTGQGRRDQDGSGREADRRDRDGPPTKRTTPRRADDRTGGDGWRLSQTRSPVTWRARKKAPEYKPGRKSVQLVESGVRHHGDYRTVVGA